VQGGGRRVEGGGWRVEVEGWRVYGDGCRVQGIGSRVVGGGWMVHQSASDGNMARSGARYPAEHVHSTCRAVER